MASSFLEAECIKLSTCNELSKHPPLPFISSFVSITFGGGPSEVACVCIVLHRAPLNCNLRLAVRRELLQGSNAWPSVLQHQRRDCCGGLPGQVSPLFIP